MTLQVDDFKQEGEALTVGDFEGNVAPGARLNSRTASQLAATDALLSQSTPEEYRMMKEDLLNPEKRKEFILRQEEIRSALFNDAERVVVPTITTTELPEEDKIITAAGAAIARAEGGQISRSTLEVLAEEATISDSGINETEEAAEVRNSMIDTIQEVVTHKREVASRINALRLGKDSTIVEKLADVAEVMAPLAEWNHIDLLLKDATGEREATLLGNQKQALFEEIRNLPISQRGLFVERIIELVQEHENVVLPDGNDLLNLDILENMLLDNDYSDFEKWFDNATSILDVLGVGGLARGVVKGGKATRAGAQAAASTDVSPRALDGEILSPAPAVRDPDAIQLEGQIIEGEFVDVTDNTIDATPEGLQARAIATHTDVNPASPSQIVKDTNPEEARNIHALTRDDETGEAAEALYGTSREEAMAKDVLPEPEVVKDSIPNKVEMKRPASEEPARLKQARLANGNTAVSTREMGRVVENLVDGMENIVGLIHKGSSVVRTNLDGTFGISMRFSPVDSGYKSADRAMEQAKFAFRNYGVDESHLTLYARDGDSWIKVRQEDLTAKKELRDEFSRRKKRIPEALKEIDYMVGLDYNYRFRPEDLEDVDLLQTGNTITRALDSLGSQRLAKAGQGSLVQNMFDASSVIHPQIVEPALVAVDRAVGLKKLYIDSFNDFTEFWQKLPADRRAVITDYINQANFEGIPLDTTDLYARGFSKEEVDALKVWREANDAMWHAANADMVKTLRGQGYKALVHNDSNTLLHGRPMTKTAANQSRDIYDPVEGTVIHVSPEEIDDLYEMGGEMVRLGSPVEIDGQWVDVAMARNTSEGGYTRALYDGEAVLAYRDGYYPVMYEANYFVRKQIKMRDGSTQSKVVASAANRSDAEKAIRDLSASDSEATFDFRKDRRLEQQRSQIFDEGSWAVAQSSGLTSQRVRGERLVDAGVDLHKAGSSNLKDPLQAVADQIQQLSQRVSMRTYLDTVKRRWLLNYGKYLDIPTDPKTGQMVMPTSVDQIRGLPTSPTGLVSDARTNFNYIYGLENGYINLIDETYRAVLNSAAGFLGEKGLSKLEEGMFSLAKTNPTQQAKTLAFRMFIAGNPARQAVIQRGQLLQVGAINPTYMPRMLKELVNIDLARMGLTSDKKTLEIWEEIQDVGLVEAVDAHNLTRQDMLRLADMTSIQKAQSTAAKPLNSLQKYGFDMAEQDVLIGSYLAHRDLFLKNNPGKKTLSQRDKDTILGQSRAFTLAMNRAGEMPYSQNTLGLVAQFFSFRHKAFLQPIFNKSLTPKERVQLLGWTTAMFGVDATILGVGYDAIWGATPPNELKDQIQAGLFDTALNTALTLASGEDQMIDFGDFAPAEAYGIGNVLAGMLTTDLSEILANAPAGSLIFGNNARLTDAYRTGVRYFTNIDDYDDPELETKFSDVVRAAASLYSGYSNVFKARYAYQTRQKMSSSGRITDSDVTAVEALLASLGFQTKTEVGYRETLNHIYGDSTYTDDDVKSWYKEVKRQLARRGTNVMEDDLTQRIAAEAWRVFNDERPRAIEIVLREIEKDAAQNDFVMFNRLVNKMGFVTEEDMWKMINALPPGQVRDRLSETMQVGKEQ